MLLILFLWVLGSKRAGGSAGKPGSAKAAAEAGKTIQDQATAAAQTGAADVTPADGKAPSLDASRHNTQGKGLQQTLFAATVILTVTISSKFTRVVKSHHKTKRIKTESMN